MKFELNFLCDKGTRLLMETDRTRVSGKGTRRSKMSSVPKNHVQLLSSTLVSYIIHAKSFIPKQPRALYGTLFIVGNNTEANLRLKSARKTEFPTILPCKCKACWEALPYPNRKTPFLTHSWPCHQTGNTAAFWDQQPRQPRDLKGGIV